MSETWNQEPVGARLYGSAIFGSFYYGSAEWTDGSTTSATWTNLTDAALTWGAGVNAGNISDTVVVTGALGVTSSSVQNDTGDGGTGGYFGNWHNNGNTGESGKIPITAFDSSGGLRVSLNGLSVNQAEGGSWLQYSNPGGGLQDNDKIVFWGEGLPSNLVAGTIYYVRQTNDYTKINVSIGWGGSAIAYVDSGSGINADAGAYSYSTSTAYCSTTFFEATGGSGSGFIATYGTNPTNGIIYSVNIIATGSYTTLPTSFIATCPSTRFHYQGYSGAPACLPANVTFSLGNTDLLFTDTDHILIDGDGIQFAATDTLPGNIATGTNYYVNDKTDTTFRVETVVDGGNVQYSSTAGSGVKYGKNTATWSEQTTGSTTWTEV